MRSRVVLAIASIVAVALIAAALVFVVLPILRSRDLVILVADKMYLDAALHFGGDSALKSHAHADNWRFVPRGYDGSVIADPALLLEQIASEVGSARHAVVVCSPLAAISLSGANRTDLDTLQTATGNQPILVGIGAATQVAEGLPSIFDIALVPAQSDTGWAQAAHELSVLSMETPLPAAVLYSGTDPLAVSAATLFLARFGDDGTVVDVPVTRTSSSARLAQATMQRMKDLGVLWIACPYVEALQQFTYDPSAAAIRWVVDSLLSVLVPQQLLAGVVADDLATSLDPVLAEARWRSGGDLQEVHPLLRVFRARETGIRSWF